MVRIVLGCEAMTAALANGPPKPVVSIRDAEPTTGLMIRHGHVAPATLRDENVEGLGLAGFVLFGLHLIGTRMSKCDMSSADLRGTSFVGCTFADCVFDGADAAGADFHACTFERCSFHGVRWSGAEVSKSIVHGCEGWPAMPDAYRNSVG